MEQEKEKPTKKPKAEKDFTAFLADCMTNYARAAANDPNWKRWYEIVLPVLKKEMAKSL